MIHAPAMMMAAPTAASSSLHNYDTGSNIAVDESIPTTTAVAPPSSSIHHHHQLSPTIVSIHEEMNPSRRCSMEDCCVYAPPGTWGSPNNDMAYLAVYDGHGGRFIIIISFFLFINFTAVG